MEPFKIWIKYGETPRDILHTETNKKDSVSDIVQRVKESLVWKDVSVGDIFLFKPGCQEAELPCVLVGDLITGQDLEKAKFTVRIEKGLSKSLSKGSISSTDSVGRKRRIEGLVELADEHKRQKVDGKLAFSEFAKEVNRVFPLFHSGPCGADYFTPPTFELPDHVIDGIYENVKERIDLLGPMTAGREKKRERFIDVFIFAIAAHLKGIFIEIEKTMVGTEVPANGDIEYAIKVGEKYVILLEAKRENFDEGKAQNYVECEVAYELNQQHQTYVYGIVTNSVSWFFNKVSGDNVQESFEGLTFESGAKYPSRDSIKSVSSILAGIMDKMKIKCPGIALKRLASRS